MHTFVYPSLLCLAWNSRERNTHVKFMWNSFSYEVKSTWIEISLFCGRSYRIISYANKMKITSHFHLEFSCMILTYKVFFNVKFMRHNYMWICNSLGPLSDVQCYLYELDGEADYHCTPLRKVTANRVDNFMLYKLIV